MKRTVKIMVESVSHHDEPAFDGMMRIFDRAFPPNEKIDRGYFEEILEEKRLGLLYPFNAHVLVARRGRQFLGFTTGSYLAVVNMGFVGYLAIDPKFKGLKVGARLRQRLLAEFRRDARAAGRDAIDGVLGEIERDNPWLRSLVRDRSVLPLDVDYRQPPLRRGGVEVPLILYVEPFGEPIQSMKALRVRALLYAIYRRLYRIRFPLREPSFRAMLKKIGQRRTIGRIKDFDPPPARAVRRLPPRKASRKTGV